MKRFVRWRVGGGGSGFWVFGGFRVQRDRGFGILLRGVRRMHLKRQAKPQNHTDNDDFGFGVL